jgi:hypothetical protein
MGKANRNDPCPCGSGQKYKKCCGKEDAVRQQRRRASGGLFSPMNALTRKPSAKETFANRVMKVLTAPSKIPLPSATMSADLEDPTSHGYGSLEELIGVEGAPSLPYEATDDIEAKKS